MADTLNYQTNLKNDLYEALEAIDTPGTFAAWGALPTTPPAGLRVDGVGDIALPLREEQVRQLIAKAHQAPFGRRSETLVDVSVRNTWEINADQLRFLDPAWPNYLLRLSKLVATNLGIDGPIRLELYKMLIYEKGAMFKPHTDTERTPGMFGTLIICLPSPHTGGEVVVKHGGECKTLRTSDASQSFACWYSDVTHEVLPVQSGYRCVLTYNLATTPGQTRPAASALDMELEPLRGTMKYWLRDLAKTNSIHVPSHLYHALDYEYTEASMSLEALKAEDFARVQALRDLADELHFEIFLALLEKIEQGEVAHDFSCKRGRYDSDEEDDDESDGPHFIEEVLETSYTVKSLRTLDGKTIASNYGFDLRFSLLNDPFEDLEIAREDYESYQGNWGPSATHWYRRSALVIVPCTSLGKYLAECGTTDDNNDIKPALRYMVQACSIPSSRQPMLDAMSEFFTRQSKNPQLREEIRDMVKAAFQHSHIKLLQTIGSHHQGYLPAAFFEWAKSWLNTLPEGDRTEKYQTWIPLLIHGYPSMTERLDIIQRIVPSAGRATASVAAPPSKPWAQDLIRQCINNLLKTPAIPIPSDGSAIVRAVFYLNDTLPNTSALFTSIFDHFSQVQATSFLLAFVSQLKILGASVHLSTSDTMSMYRSLSSRVFAGERRPSNMLTAAKAKNQPEKPLVVTPQMLVEFASDLYDASTSTENLLEPFIHQVNEDCASFSAEDMRDFWMPFLYQLIPILDSRSVSLNTPAYQDLTARLIQRLDHTTLGASPPASYVAQHPQVTTCRCADCKLLNQFLRDTSQRVWRFKVAKNRRMHLLQQIAHARIPCSHQTDSRSGYPESLVLSKKFSIQIDLPAWKVNQKALYASVLQKINPHHLRSLLGLQEATRLQHLAEQ